MKKLTYILFLTLLACSSDPDPSNITSQQSPEPAQQDTSIQRTTCWPDAWSLLHNAPAGVIPFGTEIIYYTTPSIATQAHNLLQYTIKVKNLGPNAVDVYGTFTPPPFKRILPGQTWTQPKSFQDCSNGAAINYFKCFPTIANQPQTNIVVTLTAVNAPHTLGSPVSNSMVFQ